MKKKLLLKETHTCVLVEFIISFHTHPDDPAAKKTVVVDLDLFRKLFL